MSPGVENFMEVTYGGEGKSWYTVEEENLYLIETWQWLNLIRTNMTSLKSTAKSKKKTGKKL